jgi:hypothetical protein
MISKSSEHSDVSFTRIKRKPPLELVANKVEALLKNATKNIDENSLIKPIDANYPFSSNGVYFFVGRMGTGKTYEIWRHIYTVEQIRPKYYSLIIYSSTSGSLDKTTEAMSKSIKIPIEYVAEPNLIEFLTRHLRWKMKYYSIVKYVLSRFKNASPEMVRIIVKHGLEDKDDKIEYIANKLAQYGTTEYPFRTLLVLDDFAGSPLLKKVDSALARLLTKTRHYNMTAIIVAQTFRFITANIRRLATDVIIFSRFSEEDFLRALQQFPNTLNAKQALEEYKHLNGAHARLVMNLVADKSEFIND